MSPFTIVLGCMPLWVTPFVALFLLFCLLYLLALYISASEVRRRFPSWSAYWHYLLTGEHNRPQ